MMGDGFCCPRCARKVVTAWPAGHPVVGFWLERVFHQERRDGSLTREPAGYVAVTVCLTCADVLWNRLREVLTVPVREAVGGD
jgi:hypothetical protein